MDTTMMLSKHINNNILFPYITDSVHKNAHLLV